MTKSVVEEFLELARAPVVKELLDDSLQVPHRLPVPSHQLAARLHGRHG